MLAVIIECHEGSVRGNGLSQTIQGKRFKSFDINLDEMNRLDSKLSNVIIALFDRKIDDFGVLGLNCTGVSLT